MQVVSGYGNLFFLVIPYISQGQLLFRFQHAVNIPPPVIEFMPLLSVPLSFVYWKHINCNFSFHSLEYQALLVGPKDYLIHLGVGRYLNMFQDVLTMLKEPLFFRLLSLFNSILQQYPPMGWELEVKHLSSLEDLSLRKLIASNSSSVDCFTASLLTPQSYTSMRFQFFIWWGTSDVQSMSWLKFVSLLFITSSVVHTYLSGATSSFLLLAIYFFIRRFTFLLDCTSGDPWVRVATI